jgi:hypothetical protein
LRTRKWRRALAFELAVELASELFTPFTGSGLASDTQLCVMHVCVTGVEAPHPAIQLLNRVHQSHRKRVCVSTLIPPEEKELGRTLGACVAVHLVDTAAVVIGVLRNETELVVVLSERPRDGSLLRPLREEKARLGTLHG